jgi:hypothetical protein
MPAPRSRLVRVMSEEQIVGITGTLPYATSVGRTGRELKFTDIGCLGLLTQEPSAFPSLRSFFLTSVVRVACGKKSAITH